MTRDAEAMTALSAVVDPELDEPITALGFVHSLVVSPSGNVKVNLRLPTSFCAPNFAYLMASDAKDVLTELEWTRHVVVELDDHHDSDIINAGLADDAGYRGTFGHEAEDSLDDLRMTFKRKAHTAAMERCLTALLRSDPSRSEESMGSVRIGDLPPTRTPRRCCSVVMHSDCPRTPSLWCWSTSPASPTTMCRWRCAARARRASPSTATRTSAAACCAPDTARSPRRSFPCPP